MHHTHSQEQFKDSVPGDANTSIVGMGTYLTDLLNQKYGIETYHHTGVYDLVNGKLDRSKAYQLAEPDVQKILKDNPSIEVVIDLHRDTSCDRGGWQTDGADHVLQRTQQNAGKWKYQLSSESISGRQSGIFPSDGDCSSQILSGICQTHFPSGIPL